MNPIQLALALALAASAAVLPSEEVPTKKKGFPGPAAKLVKSTLQPINLNLTDEQKGKIGGIVMEYDPKLVDAWKKWDVLTPEQKKARDEVLAEERAAKKPKAPIRISPTMILVPLPGGRSRDKVDMAIDAAVKLTDEQKAIREEAHQAITALDKELLDKVMGVLTPEQQARVTARWPGVRPASKRPGLPRTPTAAPSSDTSTHRLAEP